MILRANVAAGGPETARPFAGMPAPAPAWAAASEPGDKIAPNNKKTLYLLLRFA
jgi:hypothetical protein